MNNNPLAGYFRKPAIHMTLPSSGKFYPDGSLEMPVTKELPVYPMTALDEISYRTPDALFNGSAVIEVIKSCIPSIKDPWQIPSIDMPAILANIRIASFGHIMEIDTACPKCGEGSTYEIDLRNVVDSFKSSDYSKSLSFGDIEIFFRPLSYHDVNETSKLNFEDQQISKIVASTELSDSEKIKALTEAYEKVSNVTLDTITKNISVIKTPENEVTNKEYILEYIKNCERGIYLEIKSEIVTRRSATELKPLKIKCDNKECGYKYEQPFTLDMSTFFE